MWYKLCSSCEEPLKKCSCTKVKSDNVTYTGPTLPCPGINTNDNLTLIVQTLSDAICNNSTTSTTTTVPNCTTWEATITQSSVYEPYLILTNSTFQESYITLTYTSPGEYVLAFQGQIPQFNTSTLFLTGFPVVGFFYVTLSNPNNIILHTKNLAGVPSDNILQNTALKIIHCANIPVTPTTTTTTTEEPVVMMYELAADRDTVPLACGDNALRYTVYCLGPIAPGSLLYTDFALTIPFIPSFIYVKILNTTTLLEIGLPGNSVVAITTCP